MDFIISVFVGIPLGAISSILGWWVLFHLLVPDLRFSTIISKIPHNEKESGHRYRIRIKNIGKRAAIDLEVVARLQIQGIHDRTPYIWKQINLKIAGEKIPFVSKNATRVIRLLPEETTEFNSSFYPEEINEKYRNGTLTLEDLFKTGKDAYLQINVFAFDEFSGSRKMFTSPKYNAKSIFNGKFKTLEYVYGKENIHI
jgi:hypothetical protein